MIRNKHGETEKFDKQRIIAAIRLTADEFNKGENPIVDEEIQRISEIVANAVESRKNENTDTLVDYEWIQGTVEDELAKIHIGLARKYILYRGGSALPSPDRDALADYILSAKYARYLPAKKRRETFSEIVKRVEGMHFDYFNQFIHDEIHAAFNCVRDRLVLPSMRSMQFAGRPLIEHNARMFNCSATLVDRPAVFGEILYLLLCGCGCGFSVQRHHVDELPALRYLDYGKTVHHTIDDSIEGWAESVNILFDSYFTGYWVEFNYSQIRPEGSPLGSGGKSPGHIPLARLHNRLHNLLSQAQGRKLRPIECHDAICMIAEAVLSGGVRRSSLISLFTASDDEMLMAKHPQNFDYTGKNSQRAMANNSVVLNPNTTPRDVFDMILDLAKDTGEPGFFFTDDKNAVINPCAEIGFDPAIDGNTGFGFCNLVEINGALCDTREKFLEACRSASVIATLQGAYTDFKFLSRASKEVAERDALIGVSITGIMDNPNMMLHPTLLQEGAATIVETNAYIAKCIGIKKARSTTAIKPAGTSSLVLGSVASGIHCHHSRRYFRRVTANPLEAPAQAFREKNPHMVEVKPNGDWSLTFPVEAPEGAITLDDISGCEQIIHILSLIENWIMPGHVKTVGPRNNRIPVGPFHNVSATVTYSPEEREDIIKMIWENRDKLRSLSFFPKCGDKGIPFIPRESVRTPADRLKWREMVENYKPVIYSEYTEDGDNTSPTREIACNGDTCEIIESSAVPQGTGLEYSLYKSRIGKAGSTLTTLGYYLRPQKWSKSRGK